MKGTVTFLEEGAALDALLGENQEVRAHFAGGGYADGELLVADALGVVLETHKLGGMSRTGEAEAAMYAPRCFLPWSQVKMLTPIPDGGA